MALKLPFLKGPWDGRAIGENFKAILRYVNLKKIVALQTIGAVEGSITPLSLEVPTAGTLKAWKITGPGQAATFALKVDGVTVDTQTGNGTWKTTTQTITEDITLVAQVTAANSQTGMALVYFRIN